MILVLLWYLVPSIFVSVCSGERKLLGGKTVTMEHPYTVYLRKAEVDPRGYIAWLCGGSLVGSKVVLTSAACVEDVTYLYVIAGYEKYVSDKANEDSCLKHTTRKVVQICVPKAYDLVYEELEKWTNYDIAVIKVDRDIVGDKSYKKYCSYEPKVVAINYDFIELQATDNSVMVLGWGHSKTWRQPNDNRNFNQKKLQYVSTNIYDKKECKKKYKSFGIEDIIEKYMVCTLKRNLYDDQGNRAGKIETRDGCIETDSKEKEKPKDDSTSNESVSVASDEEETVKLKAKKKKKKTSEETSESSIESKETEKKKEKEVKEEEIGGICQNDHGGPLISWVHGKPIVIGVASVFQVKNNTCTGPFLFTSTYCSAKFLKCVVEGMSGIHEGSRRSMADYCYLPPKEKGFEIIERSVAWKDDDNTDLQFFVRPQKPLSQVLKEKL